MIKNFAKLEEKIKSVQSLAKKLHATLCNLYKIPSCNPDCRFTCLRHGRQVCATKNLKPKINKKSPSR
jgi:hypothetical protein